MGMRKGQDLGECRDSGCKNRILYSGKGVRPKYCQLHGDRRTRAKRLRRMAKNEGSEAAQDRADAGGQEVLGVAARSPGSKRRPTDRLRLAIGLGATQSLEAAAELVGLSGYSDEELHTLAEEARKEKGLKDLEAGAIGQQIRISVALLVLDLLDKIATAHLPAVQAGTTIKALTQAMDMLQGGTGNAYVPIQLVVTGPEGEMYDFSTRPSAGPARAGDGPETDPSEAADSDQP